jgi:photosystem II stability/assembly factor-like uncharacterized protein
MILFGTDSGIYRCFEGASWPVYHSLQDQAIVGLAAPGNGLLAALTGSGEILESLDSGLNWRTIPSPEGVTRPLAIAIWGMPWTLTLGTEPAGLYQRVVGASLPKVRDESEPAWLGRARDWAAGTTTALATRTGLRTAKSSNGEAEIWEELKIPPLFKGPAGTLPAVRMLVKSDEDPVSWYAVVGTSGLWRSTDRGNSWQQCPGLSSEVFVVRTVPGVPGALVAGTADGLWYSPDAGQTWEDRSAALEGRRHVRSLAFKPGSADVILAGAAPTDWTPKHRGRPGFVLLESTNGGKTWSLVRRGNPDDFENDPITDISYDPAAPDNVVLALGSGEAWITRNGGAYWGPLARQLRGIRSLCAFV